MTTSTQAGWYDDPEDSGGQRYWDGQGWTEHRQRKPVSAPPWPPPPPGQPVTWSAPGYSPGGVPPQKSNVALILALVLVVAGLAGGGFFAYQHFGKSKPQSPEERIRTVVQRETDEVNAANFDFDPALECKAHADQDAKSAKQNRKIRAKTGTWSTAVSNIQVTGDTATADVTINFQKLPGNPLTSNFKFIKEDGDWKECTPPDASDDDQAGSGQGDDDGGG